MSEEQLNKRIASLETALEICIGLLKQASSEARDSGVLLELACQEIPKDNLFWKNENISLLANAGLVRCKQ